MLKIVADANIPFVKECFSSLGDVTTLSGRSMAAVDVASADILLVRSVTRVNEALLGGSRVQFVGTATIGVDHVDVEYLTQNAIGFASAPGCNAISAAEYVVSALLINAQQQSYDLRNKTVAIVGVGNVGGRVLHRLQAMGVTCLCYDPPRQQALADRDYVAWEAVLEADIVTAHVPLTRTGQWPTWRMFNDTFFRQLAPDTLFINTGRGAAVDEPALMQRLINGPSLHVILDVWQSEPVIDLSLLARADLGTPHIAGYSFDGKVRGTEMIYHALCTHLGKTPQWSSQAVLSPPEPCLITIDASTPWQQCLYQAVTQVYDVRDDDQALRRSTELPESERGAYFDRLRKDYRRRREFSQYQIRIDGTSDDKPALAQVFTDLGFQLVS